MKNILFLDTETTGLPLDMNAPYHNLENWPRIVQLAWQEYRGESLASENAITIYPDGFEIPEEATKIHGITTADAIEKGYQIETVIRHLEMILEKTHLVVCHNVAFDIPIILAETLRIGSTMRLKEIEKFCTKEAGAEMCRIPSTSCRYPGQWKWPSLDELHMFLFNEPIAGREQFHNALTDVRATARCYFEMQKRLDHTRATII